ncbi:MAG: L,D-transpeptidase, partial [Gaiellaceae bacterium]
MVRGAGAFVCCAAVAVTAASAARHTPATGCASGSPHRLGGPNVAYAAVVRRPTRAYRQPGRRRITSFGRVNLNDVPTVFGVLGWVSGRGCRAAWYHVQLPIRPNGITGFVRARDLRIFHVRTRMVIDISSRRLQLFHGHRRLISTSIAVGSSATPTPTGRY